MQKKVIGPFSFIKIDTKIAKSKQQYIKVYYDQIISSSAKNARMV